MRAGRQLHRRPPPSRTAASRFVRHQTNGVLATCLPCSYVYQPGLWLRAWQDGSPVDDFPSNYAMLPAAALVVNKLAGTVKCSKLSDCMSQGGINYTTNLVAQVRA